ncbi:MAG: peptidoglycan-binding domain-containing protein [Candidatus Promineifilaceae bacterium]|nr:peptidoglycan-binding domain-containing protein [Candidatus Promineifilaceae bacterium]
MHTSVSQAFYKFTVRFEGKVPFMYLDTQGYVTIGIGNKLDNVQEAQNLDFVYKTTKQPAAVAEIAAEYNYVQTRTDLMLTKRAGWAYDDVTSLCLEDPALMAKFNHDLRSHAANVVSMNAEFHDFENWPADAQLGLLSLTWAQGPNFNKWPKFRRACAVGDWYEAAKESHLDESKNRAGLRPRNVANEILFRNAAELTGDDTVLYYPYVWDLGAGSELSKGSAGYEVGAAQTLLIYHGWDKLVADAEFGPKTEQAVIDFQKHKSIAPTGTIDQQTWAALWTQP